MNETKEKIEKVIRERKKELIACTGISIAIYIAYKYGRNSGLKTGIAIGSRADAEFIKSRVPEAARLVYEYVDAHPDCLLNDKDFAEEAIKKFLH